MSIGPTNPAKEPDATGPNPAAESRLTSIPENPTQTTSQETNIEKIDPFDLSFLGPEFPRAEQLGACGGDGGGDGGGFIIGVGLFGIVVATGVIVGGGLVKPD